MNNFNDWWKAVGSAISPSACNDSEEHGKFVAKAAFQASMDIILASLQDGKFVIGTERDTDNWMDSNGPIIMETHLGRSNIVDAINRAEIIGKKYGKITVFKLLHVGPPEECQEMIKKDARSPDVPF